MGVSGLGLDESPEEVARRRQALKATLPHDPDAKTIEDPRVFDGAAIPTPTGGLGLNRLSVLLPSLNEEQGVRKVIREIPRTSLVRMGLDVAVQLLDGGSSDRTREFARKRGAGIFVQKGWGKGAAFREFLPSLRSEYCVILDSDATYPAQRIPDFAKALQDGAPVVLGSRFKGKIHAGAMSPSNRLGNRLISVYASILYRHPVSDVCSGMWGFRTDVLKSFRIEADGFDLEANLFTECVRLGLPIVEVPITYYPRVGTPKLRLRSGMRIAWWLLRTRIQTEDRSVIAPAALAEPEAVPPSPPPSG